MTQIWILLTIQFVALGVMLILIATAMSQIRRLRDAFAEHQAKPAQADSPPLQHLAGQMEEAVKELKAKLMASLTSSTDWQRAALEELRNHVNSQQERLEKVVESISQRVNGFATSPRPAPKLPSNHDHLRKEVLNEDPEFRFSVLRDWISTNSLAILRRASREWKTTDELIAIIPPCLQPEAEILGERVLLIGTQGHFEKCAIAIRELDPTSEPTQWFDLISVPGGARTAPAVLIRSNDCFKLVSKGINSTS